MKPLTLCTQYFTLHASQAGSITYFFISIVGIHISTGSCILQQEKHLLLFELPKLTRYITNSSVRWHKCVFIATEFYTKLED